MELPRKETARRSPGGQKERTEKSQQKIESFERNLVSGKGRMVHIAFSGRGTEAGDKERNLR